MSNILTKDEIAELVNHSVVKANQEKLASSNSVSFSIPLSEYIKAKLETHFGIDLSPTIPMRWIKGDTSPHKDRGERIFEKTCLVYLTDSDGQFVVDGQSYPIVAGDAHMFREGIEHYTMNTGEIERLLIGPMSDSGFHVGVPMVTVYFFTSDTNNTELEPTGFSYITPYGQNYIKIFDLPPPAPVSDYQYGTIDDTTFAGADWTPPPGKKFGGWKYWSGTDFQQAPTAPLSGNPSTIYIPGEEYEYTSNSVLIPNWIDKEVFPIFFFTDDTFILSGDIPPSGFGYVTPATSSIYGTITMFEFPPSPVTQEGLYEIDYIFNEPDWTPPAGKTFGGWKYWNYPDNPFQIYPINSDLSTIYITGQTYQYTNASVLIPYWIDAPNPTRQFIPMRLSNHFSNNAMVYYKPHSLSTGGGGSGVRNARLKKRKT